MDDARRIDAPTAEVQAYQEAVELESISKTIYVPSKDDDVRKALRNIGELAELPKENRAERRLRLQRILALRKRNGIYSLNDDPSDEGGSSMEMNIDEEFWTDGPIELKHARELVSSFSEKYKKRAKNKEEVRWEAFQIDKPRFISNEVNRRRDVNRQYASISLLGTQSGFSRAASAVKFMTPGIVAVGDWAGCLTLIDLNRDLEITSRLDSVHTSNITGLSWNSHILASSGSDGEIALSNFVPEERALLTGSRLKGHSARVAKIDFHPLGRFLATASYDKTWGWWDIETQSCLLQQSGHSREVFVVSTHPDGSLLLSAGLDTEAKVWDLRCGRLITSAVGHAAEVYSAAWRPGGGYEFVTGSADNRCLVWDLRHPKRPRHEIFAHQSVVSDLMFAHNGDIMITASYDGTARVWSSDNWRVLKTIETGSRILSVDAFDDFIVGARWDRAIDLYGQL